METTPSRKFSMDRSQSPIQFPEAVNSVNESLEAQIERLSQCIDRMMKSSRRMKETDSASSPFSLAQFEEGLFCDIPDTISEIHLDTPGLNESSLTELERALIIKEDYRSFEMNKQLYNIKFTEITLKDLYKLRLDIQNAIKLAESDLPLAPLRIGRQTFHLKLKRISTVLFPDKNKLCHVVLQSNSNIQSYGDKIRASMERTYDTNTNYEFLSNESFERSPAISQLEHRVIKKLQTQHNTVQPELEWEICEVAVIKRNLSKIESDLSKLKDALRRQAELLKKRSLQIEKEKEKHEEAREALRKEETTYSDYQESFRQKIIRFKEQILDLMDPKNIKEYPLLKKLQQKDIIERYSRTSYASPRRTDNSEIEEIQAKIKEVEDKMRSSTDESLMLALARHKTQLANLRSQRAITDSALKSASIKSTMNTVEKSWEMEEIKRYKKPEESKAHSSRSCNSSPIEFYVRKTEAIKCYSSMKTPEKPPKPVLMQSKTNVEAKAKDYHREAKEISIIKAKLKEKEEELRDWETHLQNKWLSLPGADRLIPLIQYEQRRLQEKNYELERKIDRIDKQSMEAAKRMSYINSKEKEMNKKLKEAEEQISKIAYQRLYIDNKLSSLIDCLF